MRIKYSCADCGNPFHIHVSEREIRTTISGTREDTCPQCQQRVGYGAVTCRCCGREFLARKPLQHTHNRLSFGKCPFCTNVYLQPAEAEAAR
jgi:DNA-directed RNA polymerase subunit RPC12/RpoP